MTDRPHARVLLLVPARGGSKGIPRKNLRPIAGRPLVAWTIAQALAARNELAPETDLRVIVSTDDEELAEISRQAGAEVPFLRPAEVTGMTLGDDYMAGIRQVHERLIAAAETAEGRTLPPEI